MWLTLAGMVLALLMAGCSTPATATGLDLARSEAEIAVANLTPHPWQIVLRSPTGKTVKVIQVRPRESLAVAVAEGDYMIEQTLLAPSYAGRSTRRFPARFEAGESYRWDLATLLTVEEPVRP